MSKQVLIVMLICLSGTEYVQAQWTKKDSIWLQNILSGKEKLELNTETLKAIESGSLINSETPASQMQMAPVKKLPITKDFSEYITPGDTTTHRKIAIKDLPPAVMRLYGMSTKNLIPVHQSILDELRRNPPVGPSAVFFDLAKMTSRKEYVHKRNAKRDRTWREYNNLPTPDIIRKKKQYENTAPRAAFAVKDTLRRLLKDSLQLADTIRKIDSTSIHIPIKTEKYN